MNRMVQEKKADKKRFWLTFLLRDLDTADNFKPDEPHLTIITWFVVEMAEDKVIRSFSRNFSKLPAFEIIIGREDGFSDKRKIPINLVNPAPELMQLHQKTLGWFAEIGARWAVKQPHVGPEFIPHIRRRRGHNLAEGDKLTVSSLSLVSANRRGDDLRTVAAKVVFDAKN